MGKRGKSNRKSHDRSRDRKPKPKSAVEPMSMSGSRESAALEIYATISEEIEKEWRELYPRRDEAEHYTLTTDMLMQFWINKVAFVLDSMPRIADMKAATVDVLTRLYILKQTRNSIFRDINKSNRRDDIWTALGPTLAKAMQLPVQMDAEAVEIILDYLELPLIPLNSHITIDKITVHNWNSDSRKHGDLLRYCMFNLMDYHQFPLGTNAETQYTPDERVSAVVIHSGENKYRTTVPQWNPLVDIHDAILLRQESTGVLVLPETVLIDNVVGQLRHTDWIHRLFKTVGLQYLCEVASRRSV